MRIGIYREGPTIDLPDGGELVAESASVIQVGLATYTLDQIPIPATILTPGRYYMALQGDDVTGTFIRTVDYTTFIGRYYDHGYGVFTDPCPVTVLIATVPTFGVRVSQNIP